MASLISGSSASSRLSSFLEQVLFDHPWTEPDIPSLAYVENGQIVGTLGASTRRMRFDGDEIRMVVSAFFWAHPDYRSRAVGAQLLRALLDGPQDLTITDGSTDTVRRMWEMLGGRTVHLSCFSFLRVLQPWRLGATWLHERESSRMLGRLLVPLAQPLDGLVTRVARTRVKPLVPEGVTKPLTPVDMLEHVELVTRGARLVSSYDQRYLEWLFRQLERIDHHQLFWLGGTRGGPWAELVLDGREHPVGWFICNLSPRGICRVLQLATTERQAPTVLAQLLHRAGQHGATAVAGRVEPRLVAALLKEQRLVRYWQGGRMLIHARDARIANAVVAGDALLTRLDGEWWVS